MLTCKQASQLVSQSLDRKLSLSERLGLRLHLLICKYCVRFSQQLLAVRVALSKLNQSIENDEKVTLPAESKARIASAIEANH